MKIQIIAKTNAKKEKVEILEDQTFRVSVKAPPQDGKANEAIIKILAKHFSKPKSAIKITRGHKCKQKWIEIG